MRFCLIFQDGKSQPENARFILADESFDRNFVPSDALCDQTLSLCVGFGHAFYRINAGQVENLHSFIRLSILRIANYSKFSYSL
jgi:hypothetical protein